MICVVVGTRPNFMKMAPIVHLLRDRNLPFKFVHTGQHYDEKMSTIFFEELQMPKPDIYLGVGSDSHANQTARIMVEFEKICLDSKFTRVLVAGDVNSTMACALVAAKLHIPVAHVESGLRSFDRNMPEEINRIITDHLADMLFTTEPSGNENLQNEGIDQDFIYYVGNTMIDSLEKHVTNAVEKTPWEHYGFEAKNYGIITLHRPSNVDNLEVTRKIANALEEIGEDLPLIFPMHPRTFNHGREIWDAMKNIRIVEPLGYLEFLGLMARAKVVITDSGGIQEETTALGVPCLTVRNNTERPITITEGTNQLVAIETRAIVTAAMNTNHAANAKIPYLWDGRAAERIVDILEVEMQRSNS